MLEKDDIGTIHGLAMGALDVAPRRLLESFEMVVRARGGKTEDDAAERSTGIWVEAQLYTFDVHGAWLLLESEHELSLALVRELAAHLQKTITAHMVQVREEVVERKGAEDSFGYRHQYRSLDVKPDATMADREPPVDAEYASVAHGDFQATAHAILWMMVTEQEAYSPMGEPRRVAFRLPPPRTAGLPPRLAELAARIHEAGKFSIQEVGGQTMVRLSLPDGSRRLSRVSVEELAQLREATGIDPS